MLQSKCNTLNYYFHLFCQRTSVRGIPKVESCKNAIVKWFWIIFIAISFIVSIVLLTLLILRYLRYDTIIKNSYHRTVSQDFPEITICSKRFFEMDMAEMRSPFKYLEDYSAMVYSQAMNLINNGKIDSAMLVLKYRYVVSGFFHEQFDFLRNRTLALVKSLAKKCKIRKTAGGTYNNETVTNCELRAIFNPLYLNCLAFRVPKNYILNSSRLYMDISFNFAQKPNDVSIEKFTMDEYLAEVDGTNGYQDTRVFIHNPNEYPFYSAYERTFECANQNSYTVERIDSKILPVTVDSKLNCRSDPLTLTSYNISYSVVRGTLCELLIIQSAVISRCGCLVSNAPTDNYLHTKIKLCIDSSSMYVCADTVTQSMQDYASNKCPLFCNVTDFTVVHKTNSLYVSNFSETMVTLFDDSELCFIDNDDVKAIKACCRMMNELLRNEFPNLFNRSCPASLANKQERTTISYGLKNAAECNSVNVKVQIRPEKNLQIETLVIQTNNLLSQLAGTCSFLTGFTFTIIAEVTEVILFWLTDRKGQVENEA